LNAVFKTNARFLNRAATLGLVNPRLVGYPWGKSRGNFCRFWNSGYPEFTPGLEGLKTLFSLNPGVTRDSRVTPGLPLDSNTGHKCSIWPFFTAIIDVSETVQLLNLRKVCTCMFHFLCTTRSVHAHLWPRELSFRYVIDGTAPETVPVLPWSLFVSCFRLPVCDAGVAYLCLALSAFPSRCLSVISVRWLCCPN